jgi:hypothetical protein
LASLEISHIFNFYEHYQTQSEWEEEVQEEALERYANSLDITVEELKEGEDYYDEYRDFESIWENKGLPEAERARVLEQIDDIVEQVVQEMDMGEERTVRDLWVEFSENYYDYGTHPDEWIDDETMSEVSLVVDESFENWDTKRNIPRVDPLEHPMPRGSGHPAYWGGSYSRYTRKSSLPSNATIWNEGLNSKLWCKKVPMVKLDTRAIGWKAAFGIEPLIPKHL